MTAQETRKRLDTVYGVSGPEATRSFYDDWAASYDDELGEHAYVTPERCAAALAAHASDRAQPVADFACGTGLSGAALRDAGFTTIDGFDLSPGMLDKARALGIYRNLAVADLSKPLKLKAGVYANAAAVGCITTDYMPVTVIDDILGKLPKGGCFVFSVNDRAAADRRIEGRINELIDCGWAELLHSEHGDHIPKIGLGATVYVLRRR
ncbi:MAG: methyltransferase type 11 [Pseudomonadota bacterium]